MPDLIIKAGVQDATGDMYVADEVYEALDEAVAELVAEAARRAEANDRTTVMPRDL